MFRFLKEHRGIIITLTVFLVLMLLSVNSMQSLSEENNSKQLALVRQASYRAAAMCYATEGFYPSDISYLQEHYGLSWDENRYIVHYDAFASNILPEIYVLDKGVE